MMGYYHKHGGNFLQKISRLQLKLSKVSYKSIFQLQTEFIRCSLLNFQKFETDLVNFPLVLIEILEFL